MRRPTQSSGDDRPQLAVGNGRVAIPVAQATGRRVVGIDSSPAMLAQARERAVEAGVELDLREWVAAKVRIPLIPRNDVPVHVWLRVPSSTRNSASKTGTCR